MDKLTGHGRPSPRFAGEVGQHYEDLDTGDIYECRISSKYSKTHGQPVGGFVWELRAKGEDVREIYKDTQYSSEVIMELQTVVSGQKLDLNLVAGDLYKVNCNGNDVICAVWENVDGLHLGNRQIVEMGSDTGEPFVIYGGILYLDGAHDEAVMSITHEVVDIPCDMLITMTNVRSICSPSFIEDYNAVIRKGSVDRIIDIMKSGQIPVIKAEYYGTYSHSAQEGPALYDYRHDVYDCSAGLYAGTLLISHVITLYNDGGLIAYQVYPDERSINRVTVKEFSYET